MRTIKFRGKVIDCANCYNIGEFAYGDLAHTEMGILINHPHDGSLEWNGIVDEDTVGQCSGIPDKNKRDIYECDIVLFMKLYRYQIIYHDGGFVMVGDDARFFAHLSSDRSEHYEVIGNIHDNPDLVPTIYR